MSDFSDLYQDLILDHQKNPRNFGELAEANRHADGFNPLCGDKIALDLKVGVDGRIEDVKFKGSGCAISKASASMMTMALKGKKTEEAERMFHQFHDMVMGKEGAKPTELGKLKVFQGVRDYPARVKCASLAWHTLEAALHQSKDLVSTDDGVAP
ncbi:MAG TPA: SUF system NifU family Fe-S cluster assembly protein [bacterium]|nr:SUF system NifU family Fe-S cluster assembly protein [bacterium]